MTPSTIRLRWLLDDPVEELRERWTRVHVVRREDQHCEGARALCGMRIADYPYMVVFGTDIPEGAPICRICERAERFFRAADIVIEARETTAVQS